MSATSSLPLSGLRVLDLGTLFAGPMVATLLGDFGADVVKIEHPSGDTLRSLGWEREGESLWWLFCSRNKRSITLDLSKDEGQQLLRELAREADVIVESFRTGTLEKWSIGWDELSAINPRLIMVRTTGFGQTGPYRNRPGYGTLAEAMSGFAHSNGYPDGPPTLPPFALADGIAGVMGAAATMFALYERDAQASNRGQYIDLSLYEPLFWILGPQALAYDQLGVVQGRTGNRAAFTAPRNTYQAKDGRWLALSASSQSIAERVARLIGREDWILEDWFKSHQGRLQRQDELDQEISQWIGERPSEEVVAEFEKAGAAIGPIYSIEDIVKDPQYLSRGSVTSVTHERLGEILMQGVAPRLSRTPGKVSSPGPALGAHNEEILLGEIGLDDSQLDLLRSKGVIA